MICLRSHLPENGGNLPILQCLTEWPWFHSPKSQTGLLCIDTWQFITPEYLLFRSALHMLGNFYGPQGLITPCIASSSLPTQWTVFKFSTRWVHKMFKMRSCLLSWVSSSLKISLHVFHILGADNVIADALSFHLPMVETASLPWLEIHTFEPPHCMMGLLEWCSWHPQNPGSLSSLPGQGSTCSMKGPSPLVILLTILLLIPTVHTYNPTLCSASYISSPLTWQPTPSVFM